LLRFLGFQIVLRKGTIIAFHALEAGIDGPLKELGSYTNLMRCAIPPGSANAYELDHPYALAPGDYYFTSNDANECGTGSRLQISIDDD
jgi:hypothetical protein